jgi:transposase
VPQWRGAVAAPKERGFRGSLRLVTEWTTRRRRSEKAERREAPARPVGPHHCSFDDDWTPRPFESRDGHHRGDRERRRAPRGSRELIAAFQAMVRNKVDAELAAWIARARSSLVASFASGVAKDEAAVRAAISLPWSNGQTIRQSAAIDGLSWPGSV